MSRVVVNVSTGSHYLKGQRRLKSLLAARGVPFLSWDCMPPGSPSHQNTPYAFKSYAIAEAVERGYTTILWADACIVPRDLTPLWERIERDGYWFSRNGFKNSQWTCNAAYPLLGITREENDRIEHVVATAFGISVAHEIGRTFASEYMRYAQNGAFRGPWTGGIGVQHRHDQTAASVIAHRLGMELTDPPAWFAYKGGERADTVLIADGAY